MARDLCCNVEQRKEWAPAKLNIILNFSIFIQKSSDKAFRKLQNDMFYFSVAFLIWLFLFGLLFSHLWIPFIAKYHIFVFIVLMVKCFLRNLWVSIIITFLICVITFESWKSWNALFYKYVYDGYFILWLKYNK